MNSTHKIIEAEKNGDKDGKILYKLYCKIMENLRNRINVKQVNNKKDYLKCISKPSYMSQKIFDNNLGVTRKSKVLLNLSKPGYMGMCILDFSKVLMYEFYYDSLKINMTTNQNYYS